MCNSWESLCEKAHYTLGQGFKMKSNFSVKKIRSLYLKIIKTTFQK